MASAQVGLCRSSWPLDCTRRGTYLTALLGYRWFDADTIILNDAVPWTLFLPPSDFNEVHLLATQDQNGFNAGMAIFRVCEWSVQMLSETLALRQLLPEVEIQFFDQGALRWVMEKPDYVQHVMYQPHNWWNAFGLNRHPYETDRFMLHFAGVDCCGQEESKGTVMGRWLDIVENNPQQYAMELEKTKLPKEVEDYWALMKRAKKALQDNDGAGDSPRALQNAKNDLWHSYTLHGENATEVSMAIKKVEDIIAQLGVEPKKPSEPSEKPTEEALKESEIKKNADDKTEQKAETKKEGESAKNQDDTAKKASDAKKENKPAEKEEKPGKKEEMAAKKEAVEANKKAVQAEEEKAAKKEPGPPGKNNR